MYHIQNVLGLCHSAKIRHHFKQFPWAACAFGRVFYGCECSLNRDSCQNNCFVNSCQNNCCGLLGLGKIKVSYAILSEGNRNQSEATDAVSAFPECNAGGLWEYK